MVSRLDTSVSTALASYSILTKPNVATTIFADDVGRILSREGLTLTASGAETKFDDVKLCPICQHDPFSKACVCLAGIATRVSGLARMKLFKAKLNGQSPSSPSEANSPAASGTNEQPNSAEVKDEVASEQPVLGISRNGSMNAKDLEVRWPRAKRVHA